MSSTLTFGTSYPVARSQSGIFIGEISLRQEMLLCDIRECVLDLAFLR